MSLQNSDIDEMVKRYRGEYTPDVERGLQDLHSRLRNNQPAAQSRVRQLRPMLAIAAAVLLVVSAALYLFSGNERVQLLNDTGKVAAYSLPDGSRVTLQESSSISYDAATFNVDDRALDLTGQAYFEVAPDKNLPFVVSSGPSSVLVTGTAFNLRADGSVLEVDVAEGTVLLRKENDKVAVEAHETAIAQPGQPLLARRIGNLNHHAWRTGVLKFDGTPYAEALSYFRDNWGLEIEWVGDATCNAPVSSSYHDVDVKAVLTDISKLAGVELRSVGNDGKHFQVSGACSK